MDTEFKNLFRTPTSEYRGFPFWSWNGKLNDKILLQQIDTFKKMGYGGFHIHSRVGLEDEYMGEVFLKSARLCVDYAKQNGLLACLYDEDKWPSGYGGGRVTQTDSTKAKCLLLSKNRYSDGASIKGRKQHSRLSENGTVTPLCAYEIHLDEKGYLLSYRCTDYSDDKANWFSYIIITDALPWFNQAAYGDLLNPSTAEKLIETTYQKYASCVGDEFGNTIPSIFTDEPQHTMAHTLSRALSEEELVLPYSSTFDKLYINKLPEIVWNDQNLVSETRYLFHDAVTQLFSDSYFGVLSRWCEQHNLFFTGHVMREEKLLTQTECVGEAMRLYAHFQQPGIDILADRHEYSTAKQVQSVAHQYGKENIICEMFGVTNWDFDFKGHKLQADWLAALGITVRVPHLAWMYMGGESKRDYPAALDAHSPWYLRYPVIEEYLARNSFVLRKGKPCVNVAVIHPIESYWAVYGPDDQTGAVRNKLEKNFHELIEWLLFGQIDFDFIAESLIPELNAHPHNKKLIVGQMEYTTLIVPPLITIRKTTLEMINTFLENGGKVICMGDIPQYKNAVHEKIELLENALHIGFEQDKLLEILEEDRLVKILDGEGHQTENLIYQLRQDAEEKRLFIAVGKEITDNDRISYFSKNKKPFINVLVKGEYNVSLLNSETGIISALQATVNDNWTKITVPFFPHDSLLLDLAPNEESATPDYDKSLIPETNNYTIQWLPSTASYYLHEPNVLVLDMPEYSFDNGPWQKKDEILKIDDEIRAISGYQKRTDAFVQPWVAHRNAGANEHLLKLKYLIYSETDINSVDLAYEGDAEIIWNGCPVNNSVPETYLDSALHRITLGKLKHGENELLINMPFGSRTNPENCYLLGEFGVQICGDTCLLTKIPAKVGFGDLTAQKFPFYGGNISYFLEFESTSTEIEISVPDFAAPLIDVKVDGGVPQAVYKSPYVAKYHGLEPGNHSLELICYGSRINQFGQLHNCATEKQYYGPNSWRSVENEWSYAYQLKKTGILSTPFIRKIVT